MIAIPKNAREEIRVSVDDYRGIALANIRLWYLDGAALGNLPPHFAPKPRAGARQEPQVGFSRPRGGEKDLAPVAAFLGGALE
jgi:hypothetical protein